MLNILVPTDFSHDAYNALFYATKLYKNEACVFHVLHTYDHHSPLKRDYRGHEDSKTLEEFLCRKVDECLKEVCHRAVRDAGKNDLHQFNTVMRHGQLAKEVEHYVAEHAIDIVVMGAKGQTGAKELFFGGNTMAVVKANLNCPVLCVPRQIDYTPLTKIAFVSDFKAFDFKHLGHLVKLANLHQSEVHIVHILEKSRLDGEQEGNKEKLLSFFEKRSPIVHLLLNERSKAATISDFVSKNGTNLLAMVYHEHFFLEKLFREPVILDVTHYVDAPLLILPDR